MPPPQQAQGRSNPESVRNEVLRRITNDGEWDRLLTTLKAALNESGWLDQVKDDAKAKSSSQNPKAQSIFEALKSSAPQSIPAQARKEVMLAIRKYVDEQLV